MAAAAQPDSLEGWVAVRQAAFAEPEPGALRFLVGWNAAEAQFAVTCHSRAGRGGPGPAEVAAAERSWAGLFSARALLGVHRQLAALSAGLESCFPPLPPALLEGRARGLWALLFSAGPAEEEAAALDELCRRLECYLALALDLCGRRLVLDALFARDPDSAYCEPLAELRRAALQARLAAATQALRTVLQRHKNADTMVALMKVYEEEDEAYWDLVTMATQFYQYLLQPFRDMRELATLYKLEILKSLQFDNLGPKRIEDLQKEAAKWTKQAAEAVCSIQDITVNYFKETVKALTAMNKQMEQDQLRFGQASWASASPRQENLKYMLAKETLQHRRAKELCLKQKRAGIRKKMENLEEQQKNIAVVEELEIEYYETQLKLYNIQLEILKHEEMLLIAQLETLRRQIKEKQDEVVYYDTCENPEELQVTEQKMGPHYVQSSEVTKLRLKTQQLETKRGTICARRAYLRNKKEQCEESHHLRLQEAQESIKRYQQHHSIQIKRETKKEEEKKKKAWISQERQKTLERLKTFKEKCPAQLVLKTPPSQLRNTKHPQGVSHEIPALSPQPMSIISLAPQQSSSTQLAPGSGLKMPCQNIPADTPVQVFDFTDDPKYSKGLMMMPPPPPPPPPLPLHLTAPATIKEQPLPLICEDFTAGAATQRRADLPKCSVNDCTGTMDKVLASLRHGEVFLRRVEKPNSSPSDASIKDSILLAIRQGVKLRKVNRDPEKVVRESSNELERSIKAAIQRIKKVSADSEEDENGDQNSREWDS